jgi:peptidyl-prolyl cis-trans isomerase D
MASPLRKKRANTLVFGLLGLLILGLGGFGVTNFSNSVQSVGKVGDRDIDVNDYARGLQHEMQAMTAQAGQQISFAQAQALGLDRKVQGELFGAAALDNESARLGLSVGDAEVGKRILAINAFQSADGTFSRDTYRLTLKQQGLTEGKFEDKLREEAARTLLQGAVAGGVDAPATFVDAVTAYIGETRSFTLAQLLPSDLTDPVPAPSDADIDSQYNATPEAYTKPETRRLTTLWLSPEMLLDKVEVDEQALKDSYQARIAEFVIPEKRLVERLVFADDAEANAAKARIEAGTATLGDIAVERGLTAADIDIGEVSAADLGAAGDTVFALTAPGIVGPVVTDLGPALFAMNGILAAEETPFEDVRDDLATEVKMDRARRMIADDSAGIEDLLAGGGTLEEIAKETGMALDTMEYNRTTEGGLAGYEPFRKVADTITDQDFPTLTQLDDGGIFALRLDGIDPPALRPLTEVRDQVVTDWTASETHRRLAAYGAELQAQAANGADLSAFGLVTTRYDHHARGGFIADAPPAVSDEVFKTDKGATDVVDAEGKVYVITVTDIHAVDLTDPDTAKLTDTVRSQTAQGIAQDAFDLFLGGLEAESGITLNQAALNAVHARMQ